MAWARRELSNLVRRPPEPLPDPVIVLGNAKGGTTAIAALLAECMGLSATLDIPELWYPTNVELLRGSRSLADVIRRDPAPFSRELLKEPNLTLFYSQVRGAFPRARYVFVVRDPRDNIRSILDRLGLRGDLPHLPADAMRELPPAWAVLFREEIWGWSDRHYIGALANFWSLMAQTFTRRQDPMALIRYEDFLMDRRAAVERLAHDLGFEVRQDVSASVDRVYQRRGRRDVDWLEFFGSENLGRIDSICGELMLPFGYARGSTAPTLLGPATEQM